jgi:hypothetical protein
MLGKMLLLTLVTVTMARTEFIPKEKALDLAREFVAEKEFPLDHSLAEVEAGPQDFRTFIRTHAEYYFGSRRFRKALSTKCFWVVYFKPARKGALGPNAWIFIDAATGKVLESEFVM